MTLLLTFAYKQISDSLQTADFYMVGCFGTFAIGKKVKKKKNNSHSSSKCRSRPSAQIQYRFSHFVALLLYVHIPSSERLMWILTKLYGLLSPIPVEQRLPIISVGVEFRQFVNSGEKSASHSRKGSNFPSYMWM